MSDVKAWGVAACLLGALGCLVGDTAEAITPVPPPPPFYGYIDRTGAVVVPPACDRVSFSTDAGDWVRLERDGKQGFLNLRTRQGTGLVFDANGGGIFLDPPQFAKHPELVRAGKMLGYVDTAGKAVIPIQFEWARDFSEDGLAAAGRDGKYGFIDRNGRYVIPPNFGPPFLYPRFDAHGLAYLKVDDLWGAIDRTGRMVIQPEYGLIGAFSENGLAVVTKYTGFAGQPGWRLSGAVDVRGKLVIPIKFPELGRFEEDGLAVATIEEDQRGQLGAGRGLIDATGAFVLPPIYLSVGSFDPVKGWRKVISRTAAGDETTHYVDRRGHQIFSLPSTLRQAGNWKPPGDLIVVSKNFRVSDRPDLRVALFDMKHPDRPLTWFDGLGNFGKIGLAAFRQGSLWGFIDVTGGVVIPPQFQSASEFSDDGLAAVTIDSEERRGFPTVFINTKGDVVARATFSAASQFMNSGFAVISMPRTKDGTINYPPSACGAVAP